MNWQALKNALKSHASETLSDISDIDLRKLDLTRKYDELHEDPYETLTWKDHMLLYAVGVFLVLFVLWANLAKVDEITRGMGKVIPSSKVQLVQNLEGGIIDEILVKEGDNVQEGQIVIRMQSIEASSDYKANLAKYAGVKASVIRLEAEINGAVPEFTDEALQQEGVENSVAAEMAAYRANTSRYNDQLRILEQQLGQRQQEVKELEEKISGTQKVLDLSLEEKAVIDKLITRGAASKYELLQLEGKVAEQTSELENLKLSLPRAISSAKEAEERIQEHKSTYKANAQKELSEKTVELNTIKETLAPYEDRKKRTDVRAPAYGTVKEIKVATEGGVVKPGQDLMEIVPLNDLLIVEANIKPSDIAFIYPGQKAMVKITAYDYSIYGALEATVKDISADTITDEKGDSFYRVKLQREAPLPSQKGKNLEILPGMVASVDIITGKKTIMSYLLKPFTKTLGDALHER
jgi:adhesin transport system membrane fusion protein